MERNPSQMDSELALSLLCFLRLPAREHLVASHPKGKPQFSRVLDTVLCPQLPRAENTFNLAVVTQICVSIETRVYIILPMA